MSDEDPAKNPPQNEHQETLQIQNAQASEFIREGQPEQAVEVLKEILTSDQQIENKEEVYSKLGVARVMLGQFQDGMRAFKKSIEVKPTFAPAYQNLCHAYGKIGDFDNAIHYGLKGLEKAPHAIGIMIALANAYRLSGDLPKALETMEKACKIKENDALLITNYGSLLLESGQKEAAHNAFAKAIELKPDYAFAHRMFSQLHKYVPDGPYLKQLQALVENKSLNNRQLIEAHFALAKAYEDLKEYELAFKHYKIGNAKKRKTFEYKPEKDSQLFEQLKKIFTADYFEKYATDDRKTPPVTPIFIVGMPRSGTSLTEQILASHSKVYGAGELRHLDVLQFQVLGLNRDNFNQRWREATWDDVNVIGDLYIEKIMKSANGEPFITDKMPLNYMYIGLIYRLFPNAKIIHCKRDPRATSFSIFKTFFGGNIPFANDQEELAEYYRLYRDLMKHWMSVIPHAIHEVQYEELVENPKENIEKLLAYCGLEWEDACMSFHKTDRPVVSASALQVKKPLYKGAIDYWRNFEPYLESDIKNLKK